MSQCVQPAVACASSWPVSAPWSTPRGRHRRPRRLHVLCAEALRGQQVLEAPGCDAVAVAGSARHFLVVRARYCPAERSRGVVVGSGELVLGGQAVVNGDGEDAGSLVAAPRADRRVDLAQVLEQAALGAQLDVGRRPRPSPRHVRQQLSRGEDSAAAA